MKTKERSRARALRLRGKSIRDIATELAVSKGSVSLWVRDVTLTNEQRAQLTSNGYSVGAIEKRRTNRIANTLTRHALLSTKAYQEANALMRNPLWVLGVALYWGEGGKTRNMVRIANSDPRIISIMMRFFREVCKVPEDTFRGHIHAFAHTSVQQTEHYWSRLSGIPRSRFFKTYKKQSAISLKKRKTLPYGTFQIYVNDVELFCALQGWTKRLSEL